METFHENNLPNIKLNLLDYDKRQINKSLNYQIKSLGIGDNISDLDGFDFDEKWPWGSDLDFQTLLLLCNKLNLKICITDFYLSENQIKER